MGSTKIKKTQTCGPPTTCTYYPKNCNLAPKSCFEEEAEGGGRGGARGWRWGRVGEADLQVGDGSYPCRDMVAISGRQWRRARLRAAAANTEYVEKTKNGEFF
jgi:hypothetical protein